MIAVPAADWPALRDARLSTLIVRLADD